MILHISQRVDVIPQRCNDAGLRERSAKSCRQMIAAFVGRLLSCQRVSRGTGTLKLGLDLRLVCHSPKLAHAEDARSAGMLVV